MKTKNAKSGEVERPWVVVDATDQVLGRLATQVATRLIGKHRPNYTPHVDTGDFVVIVNADKIRLTGNKLDSKLYYRHSGYPGGMRSRTAREVMAARPDEVIRHAVRGMLPKSILGRRQLKKLKIYAGPEHPHTAQAPASL